jgi:PhoPQ-activated pathogenicity-related protein
VREEELVQEEALRVRVHQQMWNSVNIVTNKWEEFLHLYIPADIHESDRIFYTLVS